MVLLKVLTRTWSAIHAKMKQAASSCNSKHAKKDEIQGKAVAAGADEEDQDETEKEDNDQSDELDSVLDIEESKAPPRGPEDAQLTTADNRRQKMEIHNSIGVALHQKKYYHEALFCYSSAMQLGKDAIGDAANFQKRRVSDITIPTFQDLSAPTQLPASTPESASASEQPRRLRPCLSRPLNMDLSIEGPHQKFVDFMTVLNNISLLHFQLGSLHMAETLQRMALSWIQEEQKKSYTETFSTVNLLINLYYNLGNVVFFRGASDELASFDMYMEALHLSQEFLGPHVLLAQILNCIGRVMCRSQDWRGGLEAYNEALRVYTSVKFCVGASYVESNDFCAGAA
jgi:tetratricopeptide (TPR) repeat protein